MVVMRVGETKIFILETFFNAWTFLNGTCEKGRLV